MELPAASRSGHIRPTGRDRARRRRPRSTGRSDHRGRDIRSIDGNIHLAWCDSLISSLPSPAIDGLLEALTRGDVGAGRDVEHRRVLKVEEELTLVFKRG